MFLFIYHFHSSNISVLVLYWKEMQMTGETFSKSYEVERMEWAYANEVKEPTLKIIFKE
ncbi:hypothetical protein FORC5_1127 [Bacillus cereus]|nr:hypothetical protein FORC5_1127 [Bacillus cereus]